MVWNESEHLNEERWCFIEEYSVKLYECAGCRFKFQCQTDGKTHYF